MTAPHDKLASAGVKAGDRVRVTMEGVVGEIIGGDEVKIRFDGHRVESYTHRNVIAAPTFQIERIEPPLKVGDRVKNKDFPGPIWEIIALRDGYAVVYHVGTSRVVCPTDLERIA